EDITHEIEQQIDPLEKQAEIANLYLSKKAQLKQVEVSLLITEVNEKHQLWKQNLNKVNKLKDDEVKQNTHIKTLEAKLAKYKEIQTALIQTTEKNENAESKRNLQNERNKHMSENKANLQTELNEKKLAKERAYKTLDTEQKKLVEVTEKHQTILKNSHKLEAQLQETGEELSDQLEELKSDYIEKLNEQAVKKNELNSSTNRIEQLRNINESASLDQEDKLKEREIAKEKLNNLIDKIKNENNKLTEINK